MKLSKKAKRIQRNERIKNKRKKYTKNIYGENLNDVQSGKIYHTPKTCSCSMCCNPRRNGELTKQELISKEEYGV